MPFSRSCRSTNCVGPEGPLPAPTSYANLVLATLAGCAEPTRRLLMAAAVLGTQSPLVHAAQVADVANPLQGLEEAARTGLG